MAIFNFFGLLTFSYGAVFPVVFVSTLTLVSSFAVFNCNYSVLSHYCPELLSAEDYLKGGAARVSGEAAHNYSLFKGGFAFAISLIEVFGVAIRTVSLALRLVANLACGHILLTLFIGAVSRILSFQLVVLPMSTYTMSGLSYYTIDRLIALTFPFHEGTFGFMIFMMAYAFNQLYENGRVLSGMRLAEFFAFLWVAYNFGAVVTVVAVGLCLGMLETLVCAVQAYVFYALSVNYSRS